MITGKRPRRTRVGKPRFITKRRVCAFCAAKTDTINYKDVAKLRRYISERAKIEPRHKTGTCAKHQRALAVAVKRARLLALLPFTPAHIRKSGGVGPKD